MTIYRAVRRSLGGVLVAATALRLLSLAVYLTSGQSVDPRLWAVVDAGVLAALLALSLAWRWRTRAPKQVGPYDLEQRLGEGGMGTVYAAHHRELGRATAVKVLRRSEEGSWWEERFAREARMTGGLSHPNAVTLYDYGRAGDGTEYYAMELVDGITLLDLVRRDGPLPAGRVVGLLRQVAAALAHAHERGVLHRDIKPSNVMVCHREGYGDFVKVLDFGLAQHLSAVAVDPLVGDGQRIGTPPYMAPEALLAPQAVGFASDVYAVGVLGYFLLTGTVPFDGHDVATLARAHLCDPPVPPSVRARGPVPAELERVLLACLAKQPSGRHADGHALRRALEACGAGWTEAEAGAWWRAWAEQPELAARAVPVEPTRRERSLRGDPRTGSEPVVGSQRPLELVCLRRADEAVFEGEPCPSAVRLSVSGTR